VFKKTGRRCERGKIPGIPSGGEGGCLPKLDAGVHVAKFLEFRLAGGRGFAGVRVAKFLEFRLEGEGGRLFTSRCRCERGKILCGDLERCTCGRANS